MYRLSEIYIYPVKSLGGISLNFSRVEKRGLKYDRRWLLVDDTGKFISQRTHPQMALINVELQAQNLKFVHKKNGSSFAISTDTFSSEKIETTIWSDKVFAHIVSKEADEWFSKTLNVKCRLVYMSDDVIRMVDNNFAHNDEIVSFADAYPFLVIGQSSLDDLNSRLNTKIFVSRFRPNLVFTGGEPFIEDKIKCFSIGEITFYSVKPCARCVVTTIDQENGTKSEEPLKTLATYRKVGNNIYFGQNLIHKGEGFISVGDVLKVEEWK